MKTAGEDFTFYLDCTVFLPHGRIVFAGADEFSNLFGDGLQFAITGGTGSYRRAAGTVVVSAAEVGGEPGAAIVLDVLA
ncbi:MAG: hypothetical protein ACRDKS_09210, partial [Actinomycetota bacterium]